MKSDFLTNLFFQSAQTVSIATMLVRRLLPVAIVAALYLLWRIARNLEKPPKLTEEVKIVRKSLSEMLKENRTRCKMTQEFVAETIGVSRQAVSKWENGTSEPNTSNLMALARSLRHPGRGSAQGRGKRTGSTGKIITTPLQLHHIRPEALGAMGHAAFFVVARFDFQRFCRTASTAPETAAPAHWGGGSSKGAASSSSCVSCVPRAAAPPDGRHHRS